MADLRKRVGGRWSRTDLDDPPATHLPRTNASFARLRIVLVRTERGLPILATAEEAGRFDIEDVEVAVTMTAGALIALGQLLHDQPERDAEETTDRVTEELLRMFGVRTAAARRICRLPLPDLAAPQLS